MNREDKWKNEETLKAIFGEKLEVPEYLKLSGLYPQIDTAIILTKKMPEILLQPFPKKPIDLSTLKILLNLRATVVDKSKIL